MKTTEWQKVWLRLSSIDHKEAENEVRKIFEEGWKMGSVNVDEEKLDAMERDCVKFLLNCYTT